MQPRIKRSQSEQEKPRKEKLEKHRTSSCDDSANTAMVPNRMATEESDREARSIAIEKAYVHDVYEQMSHYISEARYRPWPRVKQFLEEMEPGSLVCDVGKKL